MRSFSDNRESRREEGVRTPTPAGYATITSTGRDYRSTTPDERYPAARHVSFYETAWPSEVNNESKPRQKTDTDYFSGPSQGFSAVDSYFRQPRQERSGSLSPATQSSHNYLTPSETLDDVDIESLIASYKPMMHPAASAAVLERGMALVSAHREKQHYYQRHSTQDHTHRRTLSHDESYRNLSSTSVISLSSQASGSSRPANMRRTSSSTSHLERSLSQASASSVSTSTSSTSLSMSPAASKSQGGSPTSSRKSSYLSLFRRSSKSNSVSKSPKDSFVLDRTSLPSTKEGEEVASIWTPPSLPSVQRVGSAGSSTAATETMPQGLSERRRSPSSAFVSGSVAQAPSLSRTLSSSTTSTSSTSYRAPIPSRFTYTAAATDGPGSMYSSQSLHVPPTASKPDPTRSDSTIESPRSSVSSRSHGSLRWSSGSARTASTSQSSNPACVNAVSASGSKPSAIATGALPSVTSAEGGEDRGPSAARSWLSLDDDDSDLDIAPTLQRKNSLWRESLDSVASSKLELEDSILATDFPQPPSADTRSSIALEQVPAACATEQPKSTGMPLAEDETKPADSEGQKAPPVLTSALMVKRSKSDSVVFRVPSVHRLKPGSGDVRLPVHNSSPLRRVDPPHPIAASVSSAESLDMTCGLVSLDTLRPALQRSASTKTKHVRYAL